LLNLRKAWLLVVCTLLLSSSEAEACAKKGIGFVPVSFLSPLELLKVMQAHWYYDWAPTGFKAEHEIPFVPMVAGRHGKIDSDIAKINDGPKPDIVLGLNEPDLPVDTQMSVAGAVAEWPTIQGLATRVGSPAASTYHLDWTRQFIAASRAAHVRVDFIAYHYYGPPDPNRILGEIDGLYAAFHLPIWITEFAVHNSNWRTTPNSITADDTLRFMKTVLPELQRRDYVERFAWWGVTTNVGTSTSNFFDSDHKLTPVGEYYANFDPTPGEPLCGAVP